ncbi:RHS repeat-associated core domain-containing protein, partial [Dokdonella soli]
RCIEATHRRRRRVASRVRLPGQYYDAETGLNYNYFRDYESNIGRYIESDPLGLLAGANTYGYALQDPGYFADALGLDVDINLFPPGSNAYDWIQKYPGLSTECTIAGHGTPTSLANLSPGDLAKVMKTYPNCANKPIRLLACNTGVAPSRGNPFGKNLARITGQPVFAPNNWGWLHIDGSYGIGPSNPQTDWRTPNAEAEALRRKPACECGTFMTFNP